MTLFSVEATGTGPLHYQWQIQPDGGRWSDLTTTAVTMPCGGTAMASTPQASQTTVSVDPCQGVRSYRVRCLVTGPCGTVVSEAADLQMLTLWIAAQPVATSVGVDVPVSFLVQAGAGADCGRPLTYQWQRRDPAVLDPEAPNAWMDLQEGPQFVNVRSPGLMIARPTLSIATGYRCRIGGGCDCSPESGFIYSDEVNFGISCPADFNADGGVDFTDVEAFFERWENGC
jgi:hypothetical protein